ncbi:MAG: anti-sigma factor [Gammaproteobacteria bacterium]|nr:anti-sigma factor [Gammaproteobacteria bacterium]
MTTADRILELLAAEAAGERLDDAEYGELRELLAAMPAEERVRERDLMQEAAALGQAAFLAEDREAWRRMPDGLRERLTGMARARALDSAPRPGAPHRANWPARWGWAAATVMVLVWIVDTVLLPRPQVVPPTVSVQAAPDLVNLSWRSEITGYEQVRGEIVWSDTLQAGEMRFAGLPPNDPEVQQYQLWIVDPDRYEHPVDGGVFDALADGDIVIPVNAKLNVDQPVAFAVTLEQRGGVVVSQGPLLLVAAEGPRPGSPL